MSTSFGLKSIYLYSTNREVWKNTGPRSSYVIAYQVSGHYDHTFDFGILPVKEHTLFIINPNDPYSVKRVAQGESICFTVNSSEHFDTSITDCSQDPRFLILFRKLLNCKNLRIESNYYTAMATVYELFSLIAAKKEQMYITSGKKSELYEAYRYILDHYCDPGIDISGLHKKYNVSEKYFRSRFKCLYGSTPKQLLINLRLSTAADLLAAGMLSIKEVSEAAGFSDIYYFSRLFKKRFLCPPSRFREYPVDQ